MWSLSVSSNIKSDVISTLNTFIHRHWGRVWCNSPLVFIITQSYLSSSDSGSLVAVVIITGAGGCLMTWLYNSRGRRSGWVDGEQDTSPWRTIVHIIHRVSGLFWKQPSSLWRLNSSLTDRWHLQRGELIYFHSHWIYIVSEEKKIFSLVLMVYYYHLSITPSPSSHHQTANTNHPFDIHVAED